MKSKLIIISFFVFFLVLLLAVFKYAHSPILIRTASLPSSASSTFAAKCPNSEIYTKSGKVPVYLILSSQFDGLDNNELCFIVSHSDFVTASTHYGLNPRNNNTEGKNSAEELDLKMARDLKSLNPNIKVTFYLNTMLKYEGYESYKRRGHEFKDKWLLRDSSGKLVHSVNKEDSAPQFDPSNADFREWWSDTVVDVMKRGPVDGVFADGVAKGISSLILKREGLSDQKIKDIAAGLRDMMALTKKKMLDAGSSISPDKILIVNGLQGGTRDEFEPILNWQGVDVVMNEHFDVRQKTSKESVLADLTDFKTAENNGKSIILKAWPGFDWQDTEMMKKPHDELLALAKSRISFPLASFLIAAEKDSYFIYTWGYQPHYGMFDEYKELNDKVGEAEGSAVWNGYKATREYACATVSIDIEKKEGSINMHGCIN